MSFQATKFVRGLRGLTPGEKAVAFVLADHANQYGGHSFPSMDLIADEAGFKDRRSAQRYVRRLEEKKVVIAMTPKTGGHGHDTATVYKLDFDYEPAMRCDSTGAPPITSLDDGGVTNQTMRGDSPGLEGRQHSRSKKDEEGKKREWAEPTSSSVKKPHSPILNSKPHADEGDDGTKPNRTSVPDHQDQTQNSSSLSPQRVDSKSKVAAAPPAPPPPEYGTPEWWAARLATMNDQDKVLSSIALMELSGNRTFKCNGRVEQIVRAELAKGVPWPAIVDAADDIGRTLDGCDKAPGLTLERNLASTIVKLGIRKMEEAKEQERLEQDRLETERLKRELSSKPAAADYREIDKPW
jgi:Helix-turn-helix domain